MFLQMHYLTSYHASLLNRDDAGLAKRIRFGDAERMRVSSQCQKRRWTEAMRELTDLPQGFRSRHFFERIIFPRIVESGVPEELANKLVEELLKGLITNFKPHKNHPLMMEQPALFGKPEADYFVAIAKECAGEEDEKAAVKLLKDKLKIEKKNYQAMVKAAGYGALYSGMEGALFGRFVTSDILARTDAPVHVAHAFSVSPLESEVDYFTVVDDLGKEEETGAAHAGDAELGASVFYGYVVVDVPLLVSNFTGCDRSDWKEQDADDPCDALRSLIRTIATVSPGAKLGATAPYSRSDFVMLETGDSQPRSLANAFLQALKPNGDVMQNSIDAIADRVAAVDKMYGAPDGGRAVATTSSLGKFNGAKSGGMNEIIELSLKDIFKEKYNAVASA